jgi:hypothetical protein
MLQDLTLTLTLDVSLHHRYVLALMTHSSMFAPHSFLTVNLCEARQQLWYTKTDNSICENRTVNASIEAVNATVGVDFCEVSGVLSRGVIGGHSSAPARTLFRSLLLCIFV